MAQEKILQTERCSRCYRRTLKYAMSIFDEELICLDCLRSEKARVSKMELEGVDVSSLAGRDVISDEDYERENRRI